MGIWNAIHAQCPGHVNYCPFLNCLILILSLILILNLNIPMFVCLFIVMCMWMCMMSYIYISCMFGLSIWFIWYFWKWKLSLVILLDVVPLVNWGFGFVLDDPCLHPVLCHDLTFCDYFRGLRIWHYFGIFHLLCVDWGCVYLKELINIQSYMVIFWMDEKSIWIK